MSYTTAEYEILHGFAFHELLEFFALIMLGIFSPKLR